MTPAQLDEIEALLRKGNNATSLRAMSDEGLLGASAEAILDGAAEDINNRNVALAALLAEVRRLREALEPFAKSYFATIMDSRHDGEALLFPILMSDDLVIEATVGDLRNARRALTGGT